MNKQVKANFSRTEIEIIEKVKSNEIGRKDSYAAALKHIVSEYDRLKKKENEIWQTSKTVNLTLKDLSLSQLNKINKLSKALKCSKSEAVMQMINDHSSYHAQIGDELFERIVEACELAIDDNIDKINELSDTAIFAAVFNSFGRDFYFNYYDQIYNLVCGINFRKVESNLSS